MSNKVFEEFETQLKQFTKPNIMVVGGTGVGKSSLINKAFGFDDAKIGHSEPVTRGCQQFTPEDIPVVIFDSEGYEINDGDISSSNFENVVIAEIQRRQKLELKDQIHLFWYCISVANHRLTNYDVENIKKLSALGLKLAVVFTKCDSDELDDNGKGKTAEQFRRVLLEDGIKANTFETMANQAEPLELQELLDWSFENLPSDELKAAFVSAQKGNLGLKRKEAERHIKLASAAAAGAVGANFVPLSDAAILIPIQTALAIDIAKLYGFNGLGNKTLALMKAQLMSLIGKQVAASLLKFIPVVGQAVNAGVAGGLTLALGYSLLNIYESAFNHYLETGKEPDWVDYFNKIDLEAMLKKFFTDKQ